MQPVASCLRFGTARRQQRTSPRREAPEPRRGLVGRSMRSSEARNLGWSAEACLVCTPNGYARSNHERRSPREHLEAQDRAYWAGAEHLKRIAVASCEGSCARCAPAGCPFVGPVPSAYFVLRRSTYRPLDMRHDLRAQDVGATGGASAALARERRPWTMRTPAASDVTAHWRGERAGAASKPAGAGRVGSGRAVLRLDRAGPRNSSSFNRRAGPRAVRDGAALRF